MSLQVEHRSAQLLPILVAERCRLKNVIFQAKSRTKKRSESIAPATKVTKQERTVKRKTHDITRTMPYLTNHLQITKYCIDAFVNPSTGRNM